MIGRFCAYCLFLSFDQGSLPVAILNFELQRSRVIEERSKSKERSNYYHVTSVSFLNSITEKNLNKIALVFWNPVCFQTPVKEKFAIAVKNFL